jgi:hypothetical protein
VGRLALDANVLTATAVAVLGCALVLGLLPAVVVWRARPAHDLRAAGAAPGSRPRLRQTLVALEVAVALALVVGATLFGDSLARLRRVDVGFETQGLLTFDVFLVGERAEYQRKQVTFFEDMFRAIRAIPGVTAAGAVTLPIGGDDFGAQFFVEATRPLPARKRTSAFRSSARIGSTRSACASSPDASPSRTVSARRLSRSSTRHSRIACGPVRTRSASACDTTRSLGAVAECRRRRERHPAPRASLTAEARVLRAVPALLPFLAVAVRTGGDPLSLVAPIRAAVAELDPAQPISGVGTMSDHLTRAYGDGRFLSTLTLAFGALALVLAVVGVYGVVGWSSAQRSREFGLRTALGATPASLSALVLRQGSGRSSSARGPAPARR